MAAVVELYEGIVEEQEGAGVEFSAGVEPCHGMVE
jgi:hypothetical protein